MQLRTSQGTASIADGVTPKVAFAISIMHIGVTIADSVPNVLNQLEHFWTIEVPRYGTGINSRDVNRGHSCIPSVHRIEAHRTSRLH